MANLSKLSEEELIGLQQEIMRAQDEANQEFKARKREIQHELDKRSALSRFKDLTDAEREALQELAAATAGAKE